MKKGTPLVLSLWLGLLLFSCSAFGPAPSGSRVIAAIPFFQQEAYQCGPAALATVIAYWHGKGRAPFSPTPDEIAGETYSSAARGVLAMDLELYARKHGFRTRQLSGTIAQLKALVDEGVPPIIFIDLGFSLYQVNHFVVVTGYGTGGVLVNTGRHENRFISEEDLNRRWEKTGHWTLVVEPQA